jgi:hypothetical protein
MGLEVNTEDVEELLEDHKYDLSTEQLERLQKQGNVFRGRGSKFLLL